MLTSSEIKIVSLLGMAAVTIGAFGAHGLKPLLDDGQLETFKTGTLYHLVHVVVMLVLARSKSNSSVLKRSYYLFLVGVICFSGSLYILSTKHLIGGDIWNFVGPITPLGGLFMILGWANLLVYKPEQTT